MSTPRPTDPRSRPPGHGAPRQPASRTPSVVPPQRAIPSQAKLELEEQQAVAHQLGPAAGSSSSLGGRVDSRLTPYSVSSSRSPMPLPVRPSTGPRWGEPAPASWFTKLPRWFEFAVVDAALQWEVDPVYEMGTADSIFLMVKTAKAFALVCNAWRAVAEPVLYQTVSIHLPRMNPNLSGFTGWLQEVSWKRERFRELKTLVIHYATELRDCPLVPPDGLARRVREMPDWSRDPLTGRSRVLPTKPGQLLREMRGYRGTLRRLVLDTDGETFLLPIGLENLNVDELTSVTYAARRFSHTGLTQNGGRKEVFRFRHLVEVKIYTRELDADVLRALFSYLLEFGPRLRTFHFHYGWQPDASRDPTRRVSLSIADILELCPNLEHLSVEPPDPAIDGERDAVGLARLKSVVVGSPMHGGELWDRTGLDWVYGEWVTPPQETEAERLVREKCEDVERRAAPAVGSSAQVVDVSDPKAWE